MPRQGTRTEDESQGIRMVLTFQRWQTTHRVQRLLIQNQVKETILRDMPTTEPWNLYSGDEHSDEDTSEVLHSQAGDMQ